MGIVNTGIIDPNILFGKRPFTPVSSFLKGREQGLGAQRQRQAIDATNRGVEQDEALMGLSESYDEDPFLQQAMAASPDIARELIKQRIAAQIRKTNPATSKKGLTPLYMEDTKSGETKLARITSEGLELLPLPDGVKVQAKVRTIDLGDRYAIMDQAGNFIGYKAKAIPPQDEPSLKGRQESAKVKSALSAKGELPRTVAERAGDLSYASDYTDFITGGFADGEKGLEQLKEVAINLKSGKQLTGPGIGLMPRFIKTMGLPESIDTQELLEEVVQRNLRLILGAQFTEREGTRLIERAYNPRLSEERNLKRVRRLFKQMQTALEAKKLAAKYFGENGTLKGFKGKLFSSIDEILPEDKQKVNITSDADIIKAFKAKTGVAPSGAQLQKMKRKAGIK